MKKTILSAIALVTLASCAKENTATEQIDPTVPVAATFTSAAITRVAGENWVAEDQIGITMVWTDLYYLADGKYENIPYTVDKAGTSGTFSADDKVIYFPVDVTTPVDFIAYYPYTKDDDVDSDKNIVISVADQTDEHIDLVAVKATSKTKSSPTVAFTDNSGESGGKNEAFSHQLSKLTMTIVAGDGVGDLTNLKTTIKGQYTEAKFNIYSFALVSDTDSGKDIEAVTTTTTVDMISTTISEAILLPTSAVNGSSIVFSLDGKEYTWDTSLIEFEKGNEYSYTITLKGTRVIVSGATINGWSDGLKETDTDEIEIEANPDTTV